MKLLKSLYKFKRNKISAFLILGLRTVKTVKIVKAEVVEGRVFFEWVIGMILMLDLLQSF